MSNQILLVRGPFDGVVHELPAILGNNVPDGLGMPEIGTNIQHWYSVNQEYPGTPRGFYASGMNRVRWGHSSRSSPWTSTLEPDVESSTADTVKFPQRCPQPPVDSLYWGRFSLQPMEWKLSRFQNCAFNGDDLLLSVYCWRDPWSGRIEYQRVDCLEWIPAISGCCTLTEPPHPVIYEDKTL